MLSPSLEDQFAAGAALEFFLHFLERWSKTPWITEHTTKLTIAFRAVFALAATIGITWHYAGGVLTVTGLTVAGIASGLWHLFRQYALQHGFGHLIRNGNLAAFQAIVESAVKQQLLAWAANQPATPQSAPQTPVRNAADPSSLPAQAANKP